MLRHARRYASTAAASAAAPGRKWSASFDKTMYYPAFLLVLLGSQVINVMNAQRNVEDLERRYKLKMDKMDELLDRAKRGEAVDVAREMELVNKVFVRKSSSKYTVMGKTPAALPKDAPVMELKEEDFSEEPLSKLLGLDLTEEPKKKEKTTTITTPVRPKVKDEIKLNRDEIDAQMKKEKELLSYKLDSKAHIIVEKPGEYVDAAKDTSVKKFL